jgi:hypothetical protein
MAKRHVMGKDLIARVRRESFRRAKAVRQTLRPQSPHSPPLTVFVSGVHRSGTNMFMRFLDASHETTVYHETDPRAFECYAMRPPQVIQALVDRSRARVVVVKGLHEAHRISELLDRFEPARAFWIFRSFEGVINSSLNHWPGWHNKLDDIVRDRDAADWRGLGMTDETHALLRAHYRPGLSAASATALFWCYRNQLFFDQRLDEDPRVFTILYDEAVRAPDLVARRVASQLGIRSTPRMERVARLQDIANLDLDIAADIRRLCEDMQDRLIAFHARKIAAAHAQVEGLA